MHTKIVSLSPETPHSGSTERLSRRSLFKFLVAGSLACLFRTSRTPSEPAPIPEPDTDAAWLAKWKAAVRRPVWESADPAIRAIVQAIRSDQSVTIRYCGPLGESRLITPAIVFTCDGYFGAWVTAYCHLHAQQRTFRIDRIFLA